MDEINRKTVWTYAAVVGVTIVGIILLNVLNVRYPLSLTTSTVSSELAVVGEAKIDVAPNVAYVDAGISITNAPTVAEAEQRINEVNNKIVASMRSLGIKKENIKTSNYSIFPNSIFDGSRERTSGYNGNATISIKVEKIDLAARAITEATAAGANQISGARFEIDNPEVFREKAREEAIKNARQQAQKLARSLGIRLGKVTNIVESSPDTVVPIYETARADAAIGGPPPPDIQPGTQTITSVVTLYFEKR